jgi:endo-1,4-beta-xylanase
MLMRVIVRRLVNTFDLMDLLASFQNTFSLTQITMNTTRLANLSIVFAFLAIIISCSAPEPEKKGLKNYYAEYFAVGVAVSPFSLEDSASANLIINEFSSMTAENAMKMAPIHPQEDTFRWEPADKIVAFAEEHGLKLRGHTLCWHSQAPDWMFIQEDSQRVSKDTLLERLENHIANVAGRYSGKIYAWDVVNEAISDAPDEIYRNSIWYEVCGEEFITKAFEFARKYDPTAKLFYNDYNVIDSVKCEKIYQMVKTMKEKGVPIDGVGIQGHWSVYEPSEPQLRRTIERLASLGIEIQITELDISIYPKEASRREKLETDIDVFTPELEQLQVDKYEMIFRVFREYKNEITSVTFWNVSDKHSWLDNFPVRGRKDYPLLFDQNHAPKKAYGKVIDF